VHGLAWVDREWGSGSAVVVSEQGWDWLPAAARNGTALMFYRCVTIRAAGSEQPPEHGSARRVQSRRLSSTRCDSTCSILGRIRVESLSRAIGRVRVPTRDRCGCASCAGQPGTHHFRAILGGGRDVTGASAGQKTAGAVMWNSWGTPRNNGGLRPGLYGFAAYSIARWRCRRADVAVESFENSGPPGWIGESPCDAHSFPRWPLR